MNIQTEMDRQWVDMTTINVLSFGIHGRHVQLTDVCMCIIGECHQVHGYHNMAVSTHHKLSRTYNNSHQRSYSAILHKLFRTWVKAKKVQLLLAFIKLLVFVILSFSLTQWECKPYPVNTLWGQFLAEDDSLYLYRWQSADCWPCPRARLDWAVLLGVRLCCYFCVCCLSLAYDPYCARNGSFPSVMLSPESSVLFSNSVIRKLLSIQKITLEIPDSTDNSPIKKIKRRLAWGHKQAFPIRPSAVWDDCFLHIMVAVGWLNLQPTNQPTNQHP